MHFDDKHFVVTMMLNVEGGSMMNGSVKHLFDAVASDYDRERRQLIPCFDPFYDMALSLVETTNPSPQILDLGAGTGLFSSLVLQKYPNSRMTLVDLSEKMLEGARERFHRLDNVQYIVGDYSNMTFTQSFDIVISSLSIHHLSHTAKKHLSIHHLSHTAKKHLFINIYQMLNEGGMFVNADQVEGNDSHIDAYYKRRWLEYINGSGLSKEAIEASVERRQLDLNAPLQDQILWMKQAGFHQVDCMFKYLDFAVFFGKK